MALRRIQGTWQHLSPVRKAIVSIAGGLAVIFTIWAGSVQVGLVAPINFEQVMETPDPTPTVTTQIPETETPTDVPTAPTELPIAFNELEVHWNLAFMVLYNASGNSIPKDEIMKLRFEAITRNTVILTGSVWNNQTDSNWSVLRPGRCLVVFNMAQTAEAPSLTDVSIEVPACNTLEEVTVYVGVVAARAAWYPGYEGFNVFYEDTRIATCTEEPCILPQASMQE